MMTNKEIQNSGRGIIKFVDRYLSIVVTESSEGTYKFMVLIKFSKYDDKPIHRDACRSISS